VSEAAVALPGGAPLARTSYADQAHETIRTWIVSGELPMGARLVETQLSERLGVSRAPVREAIRRLTEEGLVDAAPHVGATVRTLDGDALVDLYNARAAVEAAAIRLAVRNRMSTARLRDLVSHMTASARTGDYVGVARHELAFHVEVCNASGNAVLIDIFERLHGQLLLALALDDAAYDDLAAVADEHLPLIQAIEDGDQDTAAALVHEHILSTIGPVVARLGGDVTRLLTS
jgi:DNA-binding GntR family transcriptional regulator